MGIELRDGYHVDLAAIAVRRDRPVVCFRRGSDVACFSVPDEAKLAGLAGTFKVYRPGDPGHRSASWLATGDYPGDE